MTGSGSSPGGTIRRKRPFPFGLVMLVFGMGLGFYGGIAATKKAMVSPVWVQRIFGISMPAPTVQAPPIVVNTPTTPAADQHPQPPANPPDTKPSENNADNSNTGGDKQPKKSAPEPGDLVGTWTATDSLSKDAGKGSALTTEYVFRSDSSGEYDANGTKLYEFHYTASADEISVDFDGEGPEANQPWNAKLKWSLNDDKSVLTLVPSTGKDPRSFVYSLGPGVYHRKGK